MISPYLKRPLRTLEEALADIANVQPGAEQAELKEQTGQSGKNVLDPEIAKEK